MAEHTLKSTANTLGVEEKEYGKNNKLKEEIKINAKIAKRGNRCQK